MSCFFIYSYLIPRIHVEMEQNNVNNDVLTNASLLIFFSFM